MLKPLYHRLISEPWAITETGAIQFVARFSYEIPVSANRKTQQDNGDVEDGFGTKLLSSQMWGDVGVLSINGVMISGAGLLENLGGGIAYAQIENALLTMAAKNPRAIVADFNTPGGSASGAGELAQVIADVSARVPVTSFCGSGLCASAGYWGASSAGGGFYATPSSMIGSIGCLAQTVSLARMLEAAGIDVRTFTSAPLKASGNLLKAMTDDEAGYLQNLVDEIGSEFKAAVQRNRPGVNSSVFDGRLFSTKQAQAMGLIDGQVPSLAALVGKIQSGEIAAQSSPDRNLPADTGGLPRDNNRRSSSAKSEAALQRAIARGQAPQLSAQFQGRTAQVTRPAAAPAGTSLEQQWAAMSASDKREFGGSLKTFAAYLRHKHQGRESLGGGSVSSVTLKK